MATTAMSTPREVPVAGKPTTPGRPTTSTAEGGSLPSSPLLEPPLAGPHPTATAALAHGDAQAQLDAVTSHCKITDYAKNPSHAPGLFTDDDNVLSSRQMDTAYSVITNWPGYEPTPLIEMPEVARACGVKRVLYKDESLRFGLQSFKALGGAYAVADLVKAHVAAGNDASTFTAATATDGNHGRSVAWGAKLAGCSAQIYIHAGVSVHREKAMQELGATVIRVDGNYDASLAACIADAKEHNFQIVSDSSWDGYRDVPRQVMAGYSVMSQEIMQQMGEDRPTHAFMPVGVGGMAGAIVAPFWADMGEKMFKAVSVESYMSACFLESIKAASPTVVDIQEETLMAGLSCGEVSHIAWDLLRPTLTHSVSITDDAVAPLMKLMKTGFGSTAPIEAGECSTSGLAALLATRNDPAARASLGLDADSVVLVFGTEGATDPDIYRELTKPADSDTEEEIEAEQTTADPALIPVEHLVSLADQGRDRADYTNSSFEPVFPEQEYQQRVERTKAAMAEKGIDTLVVADPASMFYLSGFDGLGFYQPQYLVVTTEMESPVIVSRAMDAAAGAFTTHLALDRILAYADHYVDNAELHPIHLVCELLKKNGWAAGKTVGLDMNSDYFTGRCYKEAMESLCVVTKAVVDDNRLVNWLRIVKSPAELEQIRIAAAFVDDTMRIAMDAAVPNTRGCDVAAVVMSAQMRGSDKHGGVSTAIPPIIAAGNDSDAGHMEASDQLLSKGFAGDPNGGPVVFELASARHHYHCPMARTAFLGKPSAEYLSFIKVCNRAMKNLLAIAMPGHTCHELYWAFQNTLLKEGFSKTSRVGYSFGIGFSPDWGEKTCSVRDGNHTALLPGMCLHVIAGCGDKWCFEVSEAIVVRQAGEAPELLHGFQRELQIKSEAMAATATPTPPGQQKPMQSSHSSVFEPPETPR
jgi:diaminopropionate ammonia-lyase